MNLRLGVQLVLALCLCACGQERNLLSETIPAVQCTFLNRPQNLLCGVAHATDIRVMGGTAPYTLERTEVVDQHETEAAYFTAASDGLYPDSTSRWIAVRRYVWQDQSDCAMSAPAEAQLRTTPHRITESFKARDAEGRETTCELSYGVTVE